MRSPTARATVTLAEEGYIHCSFADQVRGDGGPLLRRPRRRRAAAHRPGPGHEPDRGRGPRRLRRSSSPTSTARSRWRRSSTPRWPHRISSRSDDREGRGAPVRLLRTRRPRRRGPRPRRRRPRPRRLVRLGVGGLLGRRDRAAAAAAVGGLDLGPLLLLQRRLLGDEALEAGEAVGVEATLLDGRPHGAARLLVVLAVPEPAVLHQLEDVGEGPLDALARQPQAHRPHARRVDEPALAGQRRAAGRRRWCGGPAGRRCAPRWWPARSSRAGR